MQNINFSHGKRKKVTTSNYQNYHIENQINKYKKKVV